MSPEYLGLILLGALLTGIFIGFPIAFTLIILAIVFGYIGIGPQVFYLMYFQTIGLMKEETLAAVPLFVFMGHMLEQAGLMERLFKSFQFIFARVRGSLFLGVLFTATVFATATGIIGASVTVIGLMAAPEMMKSKYDVAMSAGVITAGGCLGILIPPSVLLVVLGPVLGVSVVQLFLAAIFPGLILAGLFIAYTLIRCYMNPKLGPRLPAEQRPTSYVEVLREFGTGIIPLGAIIFASLGSIIAGLATPTEGAAMAATGSIILTGLYKRLNRSTLKNAAMKTLQTSSMILFLAVASNVYGSVFARLGTASLITNTLLSLTVSPMLLIVILMVVIFILGWPLEWPAIVFIFIPIFYPVVEKMGFNLVWFATLVAVNLQTAFLSPPVAMAAYYLKGVAPDWPLGKIYKGMMQYMVLQCIGLAIVLFFPEVALWLPRLFVGGH
ncbi:MAG TPA: TRAP transporter large permease subunit [Desulfobacterales bacterium]|nr:TRAP transporter large permease subunit [Desulfobacterales bacterium]